MRSFLRDRWSIIHSFCSLSPFQSFLYVIVLMDPTEELGDEVLDLGEVEGSTRDARASFSLAGKLRTDRPYNMYALMDAMLKAYKSHTRVPAREWGNKLLIFTFAEEKDTDWTRAYDLPIICQTKATLISIAKRLGRLEVYEPLESQNLGKYLCFKIEIDIMKPLIKGMHIRIKEEEK
ncbi:hypothetical protein ACS0TY_014768 [Phlomoides rotata]